MPALTLLVTLALLQNSPPPSANVFVDDVQKLTLAPDNDARRDVLTGMLRARGVPFTIESFAHNGNPGNEPRTRGSNIVVSLGEGGEDVVLGAHYDAARLRDGSLSRGAVDNAASCVMLVHLAAALRYERLPRRVRVVWFDMEELGLVGSARYVQDHASDRIAAMLNFDVNGYGDTVLFGAPEGGGDAGLRRAFVETCASEDVDCVKFARMPPGDDRSFGKAGVPTLSIAMLPANEVHSLWLLLHADGEAGIASGVKPAILSTIHTTEDVVGKVNGATVDRMYRFALALVRRIVATRPLAR